MKHESVTKFTWTLSKLMAFCLFVVSVSFDVLLIWIFEEAKTPETLFHCLPYIVGLIGWKQGWDGANKVAEKLKEKNGKAKTTSS